VEHSSPGKLRRIVGGTAIIIAGTLIMCGGIMGGGATAIDIAKAAVPTMIGLHMWWRYVSACGG
jgi:hypothetical protein